MIAFSSLGALMVLVGRWVGRAYCSGVSVTVRPREERVEWSCVWLRGSDAASFAQGQLTQDVTSGDGARAAVLQPDGSLLAAGVVRVVPDGVGLVVPTELGDAVASRLRRFRLRAAVDIDVVDGAESPWPTWAHLVDDVWPGPREAAAGLSPAAYGADFVHRAVSFTKGCYTGQELVARLEARGAHVPFRLVRLRGDDPDALDASLREGPSGPTGLTTVVAEGTSFAALGIAHRSWAPADEGGSRR